MKAKFLRRLFLEDRSELGGLRGAVLRASRLVYLAAREFRRDFCLERAASLTYATIISLFPLGVLFVTVAGSLGGGEKIIDYVQRELVPFVAREFEQPLNNWLDETISKKAFQRWPTGLINIAASAVLLVSALGVLVTAERVFNCIWKVRGRRSYFQKFTTFWLVLTTSPLMIVASMSMENFLLPEGGVVKQWARDHPLLDVLYGFLVPGMVGFLAFTLAYLFLPSTKVRLRSAAVGGLVAAVPWEASKRGFYLYVAASGRDTNFYLQVAAIPLFLLWLYLTWLITLWGGELSYVHQHLSALSASAAGRVDRRFSRAFLTLYLLARISAGFRSGHRVLAAEVAEELRIGDEALDPVVNDLIDGGLLIEDARAPGAFVLARHPAALLLRDVVRRGWESDFPGDMGRAPAGRISPLESRVRRIFEEAHRAWTDAFGDLTLEAFSLRVDQRPSGEPSPEPLTLDPERL